MSAKADVPSPVMTGTAIGDSEQLEVVTANELSEPKIVSSARCNFDGNLSLSLELHQAADCFALHLASAPVLPALTVLKSADLPRLAVKSGPQMNSNSVSDRSDSGDNRIALSAPVFQIKLENNEYVLAKVASQHNIGFSKEYIHTADLTELQVFNC